MSLRGFTKSFLESLILYFRIRARINFAHSDIKTKTISCCLTKQEKSTLKSYWKQFNQKVDNRYFAFYKQYCKDDSVLKYYIPDDIYYSVVDTYFNNLALAEKYDDKNLYDLYFYDIPQPRTLCRYLDGELKDEKYRLINDTTVISNCRKAGHVIIKPSIESSGGAGIRFWNATVDSDEMLLSYIRSAQSCIVSEVVAQHKTLKSIHESSLNTIRFITLIWNGEVHVLSAILRMGRGGAKVDNASSGGVFCGINQDGTLKRYSYDTRGNIYDGHPSGYVLERVALPNFMECVNLITFIAPRFSHISKLCSWDIAIGEDASPILIECNMSYGELDFHQICNGPIFKEMTSEILDCVFAKK